MRLLCVQNNLLDERAKSTLITILDHLGFFYDWVDQAVQTCNGDIFLEYADFSVDPPNRLNGSHHFIPCIRPTTEISEKQEKWQVMILDGQEVPILQSSQIEQARPNVFELDIIANVWYHLNRIEESKYHHPDDLPVDGADSILHQYGALKRPVADEMIDYFGEWLQDQARSQGHFLLQKTSFPQGQEFGLALTHDVDFVHAFHPLKKMSLKLKALLTGKIATIKEIEKQDRSHWGFPALLELYRKLNWSATFFFIARYFEGVHFRYRLQNRKMRKLIRQLIKSGHEIALHPSRYAFEHPSRYLVEKLRLKFISGSKIFGMRQHYLRGLFPGLWQRASKLGLAYETSLSHRRASGFRSGTSHPYFPAEIKPAILATPTLFFENTLPKEGEDVQESLQEIKQLLNEVKKHQGLFNLIWHTNHIHQPENYRNIWLGIIELLRQEQPFVETLSRHSTWIKQRQDIHLVSSSEDGKQIILELSFPSEIDQFSLRIPFDNFDVKAENAGIQVNLNKSLLTIMNLKNQSICSILVTRR